MTKVYSFPRGGLLFEDSTVPSRDSAVTAFLPALSLIPLIQHTGGRAYPVVSVGQTVKEGMLVGRGQGAGSANVHASVPGKVIRMVSWKMSDGRNNDAFLIHMEGSFEKLGRRQELYSWENMLPNDLQRIIGDYGVVEMEAQGRPVSDIIASYQNAPEPITLVVCCVFDDPWLAADYVLCREHAESVVEGSRIMARAVRANRVVYAFSKGEKELGEKFISLAGSYRLPSSLLLTGSRYPQRNRRELEIVLRNYARREAFEPGAIIILGPATLAAVYDAVRLKKPILDRYVAVGGSAVRNPQVMKVRIGSRIGDIFSQCGGFTGKLRRIAAGSPLQGRAVIDLDEPIMKNSFAVFAFKEGPKNRKPLMSCISCGECRSVCPVGLDPEEIFKQIKINVTADRAGECHGCGCCEVVCPSRLPLGSLISSTRSGKIDG
ncbi:MAG: SLBB domain-containing protein [Treponema sp.]|jgi:electron transport complex protein RnfC|nr:SLBB domain-containing protein [Treponema sp.]